MTLRWFSTDDAVVGARNELLLAASLTITERTSWICLSFRKYCNCKLKTKEKLLLLLFCLEVFLKKNVELPNHRHCKTPWPSIQVFLLYNSQSIRWYFDALVMTSSFEFHRKILRFLLDSSFLCNNGKKFFLFHWIIKNVSKTNSITNTNFSISWQPFPFVSLHENCLHTHNIHYQKRLFQYFVQYSVENVVFQVRRCIDDLVGMTLNHLQQCKYHFLESLSMVGSWNTRIMSNCINISSRIRTLKPRFLVNCMKSNFLIEFLKI